jgi:hypothetical protein
MIVNVACRLPCLWALTYRRLFKGRGWIFHAYAEIFAGRFTLPAYSLIEWMLHGDSSGERTVLYAGTAEPALIRVKHDRRASFLRVVYHNIHTALVGAGIASGAYFRIDSNRNTGHWWIGYHIGLVFHIS